jgi:hypothetical protein
MLADRRGFMLSVFIGAAFGRPDRVFAEGDHALFWRIKTRDNRSGIVFGYARIAASLAPDIVRDGERMVEEASHVVLDMNSFTLPTMKMGKLPALLPRLSPAVAAELRDVLAGSGMAQSQLESASTVLVALFLSGEGQTKADPSVGDVIVDRARALKRSISALLTEDEAKDLIQPINWSALNDTIDERMITFLLDLRACLRSLRGGLGPCLGQSPEHDGDHGELCEAFGDDGESLVVRHEPAVTAEPGEGAFDHPASPDDFDAAFFVGAFDDLEGNRLDCEFGFKLGAGIAAVGEDFGDEREQSARPADEAGGAIAILHAGRDHLDAEQQSDGIDEGVTFDTFGLFTRVVANQIGVAPPFSVAFTACVSIMAAVGDGSRPSASRHWTSRV